MRNKICAVSIIVPVYNTEEHFLRLCIDSILAQDFSSFEVILIDDGSEDTYKTGIEKIASLDSRIRLIVQENQGVSVARNNGILQAKGEYITFIDADDVVLSYFLSESYSIAKRYNADIVIGGVYQTFNVETPIHRYKNPKIEIFQDMDVAKFKHHLMGSVYYIGKEGGGVGRGSVAKVIKREIALCVRFNPDMKICEDSIWNLDILKISKKLCVVSQIWYLYYRNMLSATCHYNPEMIVLSEAYLNRIPQYIDWYNDTEYTGYVERIYELLWLFVYRSFIGHEKCNLSQRERRHIIHELYQESPWCLIGEWRYIRNVGMKKKIRALLFKSRLLFIGWDVKRILKH